MDVSTYFKITRDLLSYEEFRIALSLFRSLLFACCALLVVLALFHTLYYLGRQTPIYHKRPPVHGWNQRFFMSLTFLLVVLLLISWGIHALLTVR